MNFLFYRRTDLQQVLNSQMSVYCLYIHFLTNKVVVQPISIHQIAEVHLSAGCTLRYRSDLQNISEFISGQKPFEISEIH